MNQKQREFLEKHIQKQCAEQLELLNKQRPKKPSLNNYIVAAILDGSFEVQPFEHIRERIRGRALELGAGETLTESSDKWIRSRRHRDDDDEEDEVKLAVDDVLVLPPAYIEARAKYEAELKEWEQKLNQIEAIKTTLLLKVNIGSNETLGKLIAQADNLADLNLINNQLQITDGK